MKTVLYLDMWIGERIQEMKLAGIRRFAQMAGWNVVPVSEADSRPGRLRGLLAAHRPDGVIVECSAARRDLPPSRFRGLPVVYLDCSRGLYGRRATRVVHDVRLTAGTAFRELAVSRPVGYAFVGYRERRSWSWLRGKAFDALVRRTGGRCRVFGVRDESRTARADRLAAWVARLPMRTAVFAANDETAREVAQAAWQAGRRIPQDFTLLGVDNIVSVCTEGEPSLTSVQVDFERAGYQAAAALEPLLQGRAAPGGVTRFGPLMVLRRASTHGSGRRNPDVAASIARIRREACDGLTAAAVVRGLGHSRRLFEMRFREVMGHSVLEEIQRVRMEKVFFLLKETDKPIGTLAAFCGYRSDIALRKAFRTRTGLSMAEWRRRNGRK